MRIHSARLRKTDHAVAGCTLLYLVWALLPWMSIGRGFYVSGSVSGFGWSWLVPLALALFVLASAWALLPAFADVRGGTGRDWITVAFGAVGAVCTFMAWLASLTWGVSAFALLGLLTAAALTAVAVLGILPDLRRRPLPADPAEPEPGPARRSLSDAGH